VTVNDKYPALIKEIQNFKPPYEKDMKVGHVYFDRHLFQPLLLKDVGTRFSAKSKTGIIILISSNSLYSAG
jgi:hypothetical protein